MSRPPLLSLPSRGKKKPRFCLFHSSPFLLFPFSLFPFPPLPFPSSIPSPFPPPPFLSLTFPPLPFFSSLPPLPFAPPPFLSLPFSSLPFPSVSLPSPPLLLLSPPPPLLPFPALPFPSLLLLSPSPPLPSPRLASPPLLFPTLLSPPPPPPPLPSVFFIFFSLVVHLQEKAFQTREELELAELEGKFASTHKGSDYAKKLRKLNEELTAELMSKEPAKAEPTGKMSFEQKRRISVALGALPGDKLPRVLEIVSESIKASDYGDEEEVELDIDALDDETLRKLQQYVDSVTPAHAVSKNPPSKSAGGLQGPERQQRRSRRGQRGGPEGPVGAGARDDGREGPE